MTMGASKLRDVSCRRVGALDDLVDGHDASERRRRRRGHEDIFPAATRQAKRGSLNKDPPCGHRAGHVARCNDACGVNTTEDYSDPSPPLAVHAGRRPFRRWSGEHLLSLALIIVIYSASYLPDTTGEKLVVRHCALDSGSLTQDTELARMSHCGKFQFEGDLLRGCVLACPEDACNSANPLDNLAWTRVLIVWSAGILSACIVYLHQTSLDAISR